MDDPLEVIGDWLDALTEQYGAEGLPPWDRYEAAIALIEQAQRLLTPPHSLTGSSLNEDSDPPLRQWDLRLSGLPSPLTLGLLR